MTADRGATAELFRTLTTGVYVIGVGAPERRNGFTAAWVTQVSFDPLLLALSVNPDHASYPLLLESGAFAVSVLAEDQLDLARRFGTRSGRDADKLAGVGWRKGITAAPILTDALAYFDCRVVERVPVGDHVLVIGRVVGGELLRAGVAPLSYAATGDMDGSSALFPDRL